MLNRTANGASCSGLVKGWLSRESSGGGFIAEIDGLRFIAIFSVIYYHLNMYVGIKSGRGGERDALTLLFHQGFFGVPLFFVISGFVIALPFAKKHLASQPPPRLKQYYLRRLTRLEPPYIINLLVMFLLLVIVKGAAAPELLPHLFASLFYSHNAIYGGHSLINGVAWSLEIEFQFYVMAPLIAFLYRIPSGTVRRLLWAGLIGTLSWLSPSFFPAWTREHLSIISYAHYFLTGFLLVDIYLTVWQENPAKGWGWDLVSLAAWGGVAAMLLTGHLAPLLPFGILAAYCGAFRGRYANRLFCHPFMYIIGGMCYTIYLYHFQIISLIGPACMKLLFVTGLPIGVSTILVSLLTVPVVLVVSALFFVAFEKPFMRRNWHRKVMERFFPAAVAAPD